MSNEDSFFTDIFLDWFPGENCDSDVEPITQYCPIGPPSPSDDNHVNSTSSMSSRSKKRNRELVSDDLLEAERKGTRHRRTGESSASRQQPKTREDNLEELIAVKTVKIADAELVYKMMAMRASHLLPQVFVSFDRFEAQSFRSNLKKFKENITKIQKDYKGDRLTEAEAKQKLLGVGKEIEQLDQHLEFYFAHRWSEKVTSTDDRVSMLTREKEVLSKLRDLENQLYDKDNNKVEYKDFLGLEQALKKTAWGKTPNYLQPIAIRIEKARGKATDVFHIPAQVPVCAAIKEMEEFPVEDLDWDTLKKWGATLNYAKKYGFQVGFADKLLKKNLLAYLVIQNLPNSTAKN
ncbi:hypothetical protein PVK06_042014 [Gossypium arboreum]|uniref:Uncharacterized protein n=1 Tax=Gossypium arboreum TaxID=29729 RepID=A0ABR0NAE2_GOSAR|nr:hypothetical protein PVK06_042014 [Gossypium arboreum]